MQAVFPIEPNSYEPHPLHARTRTWPETNCYVDLWIEVLATLGVAPEAMLAFTLTQDFEGDQFTFFKVPLEDLEALYGVRATELAIFDLVESHISEQITRGRLCMVEMDSFFMPDTRGTSYGTEHGKTTIAINRMNVASRTLDYFHNGGFYHLEGGDFDGVFQHHLTESDPPFLPYTEFAKFPKAVPGETHQRRVAEVLMLRHFARRPWENPVRAFANVFPAQAAAIAERPFGFFHKYAFNTLRQLGANFELVASYLRWLGEGKRFASAAADAGVIAETSKAVQFLLARAVMRKKFDPLVSTLTPAVDAWDRLMATLTAELGHECV
ncbi:DUF1839 family protein [Rhizobium sp. RCC_161_2]|uniref:DUF1839 family protein n=1 Tax=Rhizobium sp. RCC_161_2 TaxID=3239219 RepID=UPI0035265BF8